MNGKERVPLILNKDDPGRFALVSNRIDGESFVGRIKIRENFDLTGFESLEIVSIRLVDQTEFDNVEYCLEDKARDGEVVINIV